MVEGVSRQLLGMIQAHGGAAVFAAVALKSLALPLPTPPVVMGAGAMLVPADAAPGAALLAMLLKVALPGALGMAAGAYLLFAAGYKGGKPLVDRLGRSMGLTWESVSAFSRRLSRRAGWWVFVSRAIPVVPLSVVSAAAGLARMRPAKFGGWTFAGSVLRCLALGYLGWLAKIGALSFPRP